MTIAKPNDDYTQVIQEMLEIAGKHGVNLIPEGIEMNESGMDFLVGFAEEGLEHGGFCGNRDDRMCWTEQITKLGS